MKKFLIFMCMFLLLIFNVVQAAEIIGELNYWHSNDSSIGYWSNSPRLFLNYNSSYPTAQTAAQYASQQWSNAGISNYFVATASEAEIGMYAYTYSELKVVFPNIKAYSSGYTTTNRTFVGNFLYNSSYKNGYRLNYGYVCLITDVSTNYNKTFTHELGHGLGWDGHSTNSNDVMYSETTSISTLTTRDKNHLNQVY